MWIKICANTNIEDALLAVELGADAVGFVFAPSRRRVSPAAAGAITRQLPGHVERIGVFGSSDAEEIIAGVREAGLSGVQLHGASRPGLPERLREVLGDGVTIIQTLHWEVRREVGSGASSAQELLRERETIVSPDRGEATKASVDRVLIDSQIGTESGGTGVPFDWAAAAQVFRSTPEAVRTIVAGGLHSGNVERAIRKLEPWGVDVASGVESVPGRKDPDRLAAFIQSARRKNSRT